MQRFVGIGHGRQQRLNAGADAFRNAVAQARYVFARARRIAKLDRFKQTLHGVRQTGPLTQDYSFRAARRSSNYAQVARCIPGNCFIRGYQREILDSGLRDQPPVDRIPVDGRQVVNFSNVTGTQR